MANGKKIKSRKLNKKGNIDVNDLESLVEDKSILTNRDNNKKIKTKKICMSLSKAEERKLDNDMVKEEKISITVIVIILFFCFAVGISLGYILYKIAITGSI